MDFYAGKMSLLNDIAQIETTLGDPGARPRRPLPDPKDTHRSTHTQMALFGPTIAWYEAYNPAIAQVNPSTCISRPSRKSSPAEPNPIRQSREIAGSFEPIVVICLAFVRLLVLL
jgi:hypothetical protein